MATVPNIARTPVRLRKIFVVTESRTLRTYQGDPRVAKAGLGALALLFAASCLSREVPLAPAFEALSADVTVVRDRNGVPHVFGATDADVAFAAGYEQARDRLFQMDLLRRTAQGRMAEVFGERHKDTYYVDQDWLLRAVGLYRSAQETAAWMRRHDARTWTMLSAFAAGVNAFLEDATHGREGASLPPGFGPGELGYAPEPWRPEDSVAIGKLQSWALSSTVAYELLSTLIQYVLPADELADLVTYRPPEPVFILDGFPPAGGVFGAAAQPLARASRKRPLADAAIEKLAARVMALVRALSPLGLEAGSNNWVVSGAHTWNGKPILCNDPHLPLASPPNLYLFHLNTADRGGDLDVAGAGFPGAPVVVIGHNRRIAWGATVARGDVSDIFAETLTADRRRTVHLSGEEGIVEWEEVIRVRKPGRPVGEFEERTVKIQRVPRHGPVLPAEATLPPVLAGADLLSFAWTGLGVTNEVGAFVRLNRATNIEEFRRAMEEFSVGAQNFLYADGDGHIALYAHARYPLRKRLDPAKPPWFAVPGSGDYDWTGGYVPRERVPQALDPPAGFIATANNDPVGATADGDPLNDLYYLGPLYDPGYRAWRIDSELRRLVARARAGAPIEIDDMKALQNDTFLRIAERFRPHLASAWEAARTGAQPALARFANNPRIEEASARLAAWDLRARADSPESALFHLWLGYFAAGTLRDEIGGAIYDRAAAASLDVVMRPLLFLADNPRTASGYDYFNDVRRESTTETREQIVLEALEKALAHGARLFATEDLAAWRWSAIHRAHITGTFGGAFDLEPVEIPGGLGSVNVAEPALTSPDNAGGPPDELKVTAGANLRMIVTFDESGRPRAQVVIAGGQSGVPGHPHFADQIGDWAAGRYRPLPFTREEVEAAAESRHIFPAGFPRRR
jgi:penicillin amidase